MSLAERRERSGGLDPITDFATGSIFALDAAKDGKTLYFLYGNESTDIVLLKNFR